METSAAKISELLAGRADAVSAMLLPGGKLNGRDWVCGNINGDPGDSLKVTLYGGYAGQWRDWSTDTDHGDLLDLWRLARALSPGEAIKQAKEWLGIHDSIKIERRSYSKAPVIDSIPPQPFSKSREFLVNKRKIKPSTLEKFKIEVDVGKKAIVFPCYSPSGEIVNRSYRTLDEKKKVWQDTGCAPSLFGWQAVTEDALRSRTIILSEGQLDCATWNQWGFNALSIPNGSGCSWIDYEWDNLAIFDTIYLAFDQDEAGRKITEAVATRLGRHRCLLVAMPKKDANDCLMSGFGPIDAKEWIEAASPPKINKLITVKEMGPRLHKEIEYKPQPFTLDFMAQSWEEKRGFWFRPAEVTVWGGFTGAGKSTMLNFMVANLIGEQHRVMVASLELRAEIVTGKILSIFYHNNYTNEHIDAFCSNTGNNLAFADIVGNIGKQELMEMLWFSYRRYGVSHFIIDSLMRIDGLEEDYPAQGKFLGELQAFVKETGGHVHLVAHLSKPGESKKPTMYNVKGSSLLVNNADNVLLINQNPDKVLARKKGPLTDEQERSMHDTEVIVEKQRDTGWVGTFKLNFNKKNNRFTKFGSI